MVIKKLNFADFAIDPKLGIKDYSTIHFKNGVPLKLFLSNKNVETDIKSGRTPSKYNEDYWNGEYSFLTMQDVDTATFEVHETTEKITDYAIEEERTLYLAPKNALLISNAMTVGMAFTSLDSIYINQNVFHINIDETMLNKTFIKWYFNLIFRPNFEKIFTSKYYSKEEYGRLKIPNISIEMQNTIANRITRIEKKIRMLKLQIKEPLAVINKVFSEFYGFSDTLWLEVGKGMTAGTQKSYSKSSCWYEVKNVDISNSTNLRFSTRFHKPIFRNIKDILLSKPFTKISKIITTEIKRGVQPKLDKDGEVYSIKTGQLKNSFIDVTEADKVTKEFFNAKMSSQVQQDDVLIASTGKVSLGKADVYELEEDSLVDGHVSILRIDKEKYNIWFLTYFLRSILGAYQIEREYTGATNQIELYPEQISEFLIPDFDLDLQEDIVYQIKVHLDLQKKVEKEIDEYRKEIRQVIESNLNS